MKNFATQFWGRLQEYKERPALHVVEEGKRVEVTFWEWTRRLQNLAVALMEEGFEPGTRLGLVAPNSRGWLDLAMATWLVGGCVVPLVPGRERRETLRCLGRSGCDWIAVADRGAFEQLRGPGGQLPGHLRWVYVDGEASGEGEYDLKGLEEEGRSLVRRGRTRNLAERIYGLKAKDPTVIFFDPEPDEGSQGCFFSGEKVAWELDAIAGQMGLKAEDEGVRVASALSYGWFSSFLFTVAALVNGHSVAVAPSLRQLSEASKTLRPTHLVCGPAYLEDLGKEWQRRLDDAPDLLRRLAGETGDPEADSTAILRTLGSVGSVGERAVRRLLYDPIRADFGGQLRSLYVWEGRADEGLHEILNRAGVALLGHFGLPEAGLTHVEHPEARRRQSVGRPVEGVAVKIDGVKTGEVGEICVKGDVIFDGYWAGEGRLEVDDEGWLYTGRRGRLESGFLFLE